MDRGGSGMRYYIKYTEDGKVHAVGTGLGGTEITQEEYEVQRAIILQKNELTDKLYRGEIALEDVPEEWREEIKSTVEELIATQGEYQADEIEEALEILRGDVSE